MTSASRGTFSRISVSSVSRLAIISGSVAFLAPEIGMRAVQPLSADNPNSIHVALPAAIPALNARPSIWTAGRPLQMAICCKVTTLAARIRRKSGFGFPFRSFSALPAGPGVAAAPRWRSCALRRRRFSRNAAARRSLRPPFLPIFFRRFAGFGHGGIIRAPSRTQAGFACTGGGRMAVSAAFAPGLASVRGFAAVAQW